MSKYLLLLVLTAGCSAPRVWTTQRIGPVKVNGDLAMNVGGAGGSTSADQLGLEDDDTAWSPRLDFDFAGLHINVNRLASEHSGNGMTNSTLTLDGAAIPAARPVRSELDFEMNTAALTFDFIPTSLVDVGIGIGAGTIAYDIDIQDTTTPANRVQSDEEAPMGFIAGRAASELGDFLLSLDVAWIKVEIDDDELLFVDYDAALSWTFFSVGPGFGQLVLGYRLTQAELEFEDGNSTVDANLDFKGAYLGLSLGI